MPPARSARYTVTEPVGRASRVFRGVAESADLIRYDVAIVRVLPALTKNQKFVHLFLEDLRPTLGLKHANIVECLDIAKTPEDAYFAVTEYVDGCNLKALVAQRERLAVPEAIRVTIECCKGLAHAHSRNLVHRDVSPQTVLLSSSGEVKLADFGLAKVNSQIESSDPGIVKGKFSYLSPEAARGVDVDHRGDLFAAGIVLWELLAGRRLFVGQTDYQTVELVREARIPHIDAVDPALDAIVVKALARETNARYQTATDFGDALARYAVSHRISQSPAELAGFVREAQADVRQQRALHPVDPRHIEGVKAEVSRMTSIVHRGNEGNAWN
jgi:serine/threonine-protein kinase